MKITITAIGNSDCFAYISLSGSRVYIYNISLRASIALRDPQRDFPSLKYILTNNFLVTKLCDIKYKYFIQQ